MKLLDKKIAFITGASSGIGMASAKAFAKEGADLILTARRGEKLKEFSKEIIKNFNVDVLILQFDIRNFNQVKEKISSLSGKWKNIDILLNNAGLAKGFGKIYESNIDDWEVMIDTNIKGLLYVTRLLVPGMVERNSGHIINIGSTAGHEVYVKGNVYCATKFAVNALTQSIRLDVLDKNIKVTSVDPGMVYTEFSMVRFSGDKDKADKVYEGITPLKAEDVANAIFFCATTPSHVNINEIIMTPIAQASSTQIFRKNKEK